MCFRAEQKELKKLEKQAKAKALEADQKKEEKEAKKEKPKEETPKEKDAKKDEKDAKKEKPKEDIPKEKEPRAKETPKEKEQKPKEQPKEDDKKDEAQPTPLAAKPAQNWSDFFFIIDSLSYNIDMCDLILFMTKINPVPGIEHKKVNVEASYMDTATNTLIFSHTDAGIMESLLGIGNYNKVQ